jgi:hypothetical protein
MILKGGSMYIHEAIEKAGEGGKIRRRGWMPDEHVVSISGTSARSEDYLQYQSKNSEGHNMVPLIADLTADDWEVVAPEIQVGDIVLPYDNPTSHKGTVVEMGNGDKCCVKWMLGTLEIRHIGSLEFISRPEKPVDIVYENVYDIEAWNKDGKKVIETEQGKRYTMTLTEVTL